MNLNLLKSRINSSPNIKIAAIPIPIMNQKSKQSITSEFVEKTKSIFKIDEPIKNINQSSHCCIIRMTLKKNNVFVNLTKTNGETILKFSAGLIQKKKSKKQLRSLIKWIFEKLAFFAKANFDYVKVIIKGHTNTPFSYLKEIKRKQLKLIAYQHIIPVIHNGCRPPKKRRI